MLLILLILILVLLPLVLTTSFPHLLVLSIYAGIAPWLALGWAGILITLFLRRKRIAEWRRNRSLKKRERNLNSNHD